MQIDNTQLQNDIDAISRTITQSLAFAYTASAEFKDQKWTCNIKTVATILDGTADLYKNSNFVEVTSDAIAQNLYKPKDNIARAKVEERMYPLKLAVVTDTLFSGSEKSTAKIETQMERLNERLNEGYQKNPAELLKARRAGQEILNRVIQDPQVKEIVELETRLNGKKIPVLDDRQQKVLAAKVDGNMKHLTEETDFISMYATTLQAINDTFICSDYCKKVLHPITSSAKANAMPEHESFAQKEVAKHEIGAKSGHCLS